MLYFPSPQDALATAGASDEDWASFAEDVAALMSGREAAEDG